jgi:phospholipase/carboxylesterase
MNEPANFVIQDALFRVFPPAQPTARAAILAIHGYTGNEHSMEIFTQKMSSDCWAILPRAIYPVKTGGFSWIPEGSADRSDFRNLNDNATLLKQRVDQLQQELKINGIPLFLMGFSQGAALALVYSLRFSHPGDRIGLMAGFLPTGLDAQPGSLRGRRFFIAHGRRDATVPFEQAHRIKSFLEKCNAQFDLCESDSGHKLSMACFRRLEDFFRERSSALG